MLDKGTALPVLREMQDVTAWNYGGAFSALPLYAGYIENVESWIHFNAITVSEGETTGIGHDWGFVDPNGDGELTSRERGFQQAFQISIEDGLLKVFRTDSGEARIRLTGSALGQERSIEIDLVGYSPEALRSFPASVIHEGGWIENPWYGWMVADEFPYIQHLNHGYQYVIVSFGDFADEHDYYIYDFQLGSWLYSKGLFYPLIYVYNQNAWIWYFEGSGNGANLLRWFYNYGTGEYFQG